jgi:hypothetical protein
MGKSASGGKKHPFWQWFGRESDDVFVQYDDRLPADQNAIDMLDGWTSAFPNGLEAGRLPLFADGRIEWGLNEFGPLEGKTVLEIGPLEGMHSYMINQRQPASLLSIEANRLCFLRCLVAKEILGMDRTHFMLGDAMAWMAEREDRYDLLFASGVLYHMAQPVEFLRLASLRTDALFLWTHFYLDEGETAADGWRQALTGRVVVEELEGVPVRCYERSYRHAEEKSTFCGGPRDRHYWIHRADLLALLAALGFTSIEIMGEETDHIGGPCFSLLARR